MPRVKLGTPRDGCDYINANLLSSQGGEHPPWSCIATQGPVKGTLGDFWQMVHEQRCDTVREKKGGGWRIGGACAP